jgi:rubredoxin
MCCIFKEEHPPERDIYGAVTMQETTKLARWVCLECAYIYDPAKGDKKNGIPPGVPFEKLPLSWRCPECNLSIEKHGIFKRLDD